MLALIMGIACNSIDTICKETCSRVYQQPIIKVFQLKFEAVFKGDQIKFQSSTGLTAELIFGLKIKLKNVKLLYVHWSGTILFNSVVSPCRLYVQLSTRVSAKTRDHRLKV